VQYPGFLMSPLDDGVYCSLSSKLCTGSHSDQGAVADESSLRVAFLLGGERMSRQGRRSVIGGVAKGKERTASWWTEKVALLSMCQVMQDIAKTGSLDVQLDCYIPNLLSSMPRKIRENPFLPLSTQMSV
jgi:hypothetical protein